MNSIAHEIEAAKKKAENILHSFQVEDEEDIEEREREALKVAQQKKAEKEVVSVRLLVRRPSVIKSDRVRHTLAAWAACIVVGITVGMVDGAIVEVLHWLHDWKTHVLDWTTNQHNAGVSSLVMLSFCLPFTLIAAAAVILIAPKAAGSGLAEVKAMLNGSHISKLLTFFARLSRAPLVTWKHIEGSRSELVKFLQVSTCASKGKAERARNEVLETFCDN